MKVSVSITILIGSIILFVLGIISFFIKSDNEDSEKPTKTKNPHQFGTHGYYCHIIAECIEPLKKTLKYSCKTVAGEFIEMWKDDNGDCHIINNRGFDTFVSLYEDGECFGIYTTAFMDNRPRFTWVGSETNERAIHFNRCKFADWKRKYK